MSLSAGTQLGPYEVLGPLGAGGMGEVYRARDTRLGRQVAVKILPDAVSQDPRRVARFETEARALAALSHPNVLAIHDVGRVDGRFYAVTELLEGETLRGRMVDGSMPWRKAAEIGAAIADGLASAHAAGIVHRDLKPENVSLTTDGRLKILDFGLATYAEPVLGDAVTLTSPSAGTLSGEVVGTLSYMAPEQLRSLRVDGRTDIFALGCVLYEMLAGKRPFTGATPADTLAAILHHDPKPFAPGAPGTPPGLQTIVFRCLEKRPEDRYDTAHDLAIALRGVSAEQPVVRSGESPPAAPPNRGTRLMALGIGSAVALGGLLFIARLTRTSVASSPESERWSVAKQITSAPGWDAEPAVSPDGTLIAYSSNAAGSSDIWLVDVRGGEPLRLTSRPGDASTPAWFPDGSAVAFTSTKDGRSSVWKVARLGGSPSLLVEDAQMPALSPDGKRLAFARSGLSPGGLLRIWTAPLERPAEARRLTGDDAGFWHHVDPSWSPDGARICYSDFKNLWIVDVDTHACRQLTTDDEVNREPAWSASGRSIYFSSLREGFGAIWSVAPEGGVPKRETTGTGPERHPAVSRDGSRLVYSTSFSDHALDVLVIDRKTGAVSRFGSALTDAMPAIAPDGSAMVFSSDRLGKFDLWFQPLVAGRPTEASPRRLTDLETGPATPSFSPDGKWVAFFRAVKGQRDIWIMPAEGGMPVRIVDAPGTNIQPAFSRDGSRLAFAAGRSGPVHLCILPMRGSAAGGSPWQLTDGEMPDMFPVFSPDGSTLAFLRDGEIWVTAATRGASPRKVTTGADARRCVWETDGRSLLASGAWGSALLRIRRVDPDSGSSEPVAPDIPLGNRDAPGSLGLSRDGRYLAADVADMKGNLWTIDLSGGRS